MKKDREETKKKNEEEIGEEEYFEEEEYSTSSNSSNQSKLNISTPAAIVLAGIVIAGAIIYSSQSSLKKVQQEGDNPLSPSNPAVKADKGPSKVVPISSEDHIYGPADASLKIIEFSDTECPFCKSFHPTLKRLVSDYNGKIAWIYRHFPLDSIHPKSRKEAQATECAAELGGNEKFWAYLDKLFEITPSNNNLDPSKLPEIAQIVGLDKNKFQECLESNRYAQKVAQHLQDALNSGGEGTPYSVIISPKGGKYAVSGAIPYQEMKSIIDTLLSR
ncbi:MAG: DsbA family protein [Patescibacteria group bacterium]|nr:DsbA family protein [Patescibacteria group bacterium]